MTTFASMKTSIAQRLIDPSSTAVSLANVGTAINDAITYWKYKRFWFNEASEVKTMTVGVSTLTMPTDFLYELPENGFVINYNNLSYTMKKKPPREFDATNVRGNGLPYIYTFRNGSYEFYFYPQIAYLMSIYYIKDYDTLVNDSDYNDFTVYAEKLITYEALSRLSAELRQDEKMEAYYSRMALKEYDNLTVRTFQQTKSGSLSTETILSK